ncbi:MAG: hypothetical protein NT098_00350 [Candidatus Parcubacteria bacterium]|nr:hypothetical protein [Candidatus Parcubacteria bacterium]
MKNNEQVYIKKIDDHEGFEVWLVDGSLVRRDLDENFTEYEHHARYKFIPANEIWIEKDTNEEEWKYFLENLDLERKYMEEGLSLEEAVEKANAREQKDRRLSPRIQKILDSHHTRKEALEKIRKEKIEEWCTPFLTVWRIDGSIVRALYMVDYADGGHDLVYDFVPKNEIWIEEVLDENERKFILLHEMHERYLMSQGKDYHHAHEGATIIEAHYRKNPEGLEERMQEELEKNNF